MRYRILALALLPLLLSARAEAAATWEFDGACKALSKEGDRTADLSKAAPKPILCDAAILIRNPSGVAVLTAGMLAGGGTPLGFGTGNFQLGSSPGKMIMMPVDTMHVGSVKGVTATGSCAFFGPDLGKVSTISCIASVIAGSRKTLYGVNIHVTSDRVIHEQ